MNVLAQIFGIIGLIFLVISIQNNKKKIVLLFQIVSNMFYGLQYIVLNSLSAGMMSFISLIRCIIYYLYNRNNKIIPKNILILFIIIIISTLLFTYNGLFSIIPILATILYTYGTWTDNLKLFRYIAIIAAILWIVFNFYVGAYVAFIGSIFELLSGLLAIYRFDIRKVDING